jgi:hypothetical protein
LIIYLDKSIKTQLVGPNSKDSVLFFDELLMADYRSNHVVFIDSELAEYASDIVSSNLKGWLTHIDQQTTKLAALVLYVKKVLVITDGSSDTQTLPCCLQDKAVFISFGEIKKRNISQTILLCENLDDCKFYMQMTRYYEKKHKIRSYTHRCETVNGGGSTTYLSYENAVCNNGRFTLCIADSDKHYADTSAPEGQTLKELRRTNRIIQESGKDTICELLPLTVMEAENLIPYSLLEQIFLSEPVCKEGLETLKTMVTTFSDDSSHSPVLFYDLKKGLRIKDCAKCVHKEIANYWRNVFQRMGDDISTQYDDYSNERYEALSKEEKEKTVRSGLQQHEILQKVVKYLETDENLNLMQIDLYLVDLWESIGMVVFTWTCAPTPHSC